MFLKGTISREAQGWFHHAFLSFCCWYLCQKSPAINHCLVDSQTFTIRSHETGRWRIWHASQCCAKKQETTLKSFALTILLWRISNYLKKVFLQVHIQMRYSKRMTNLSLHIKSYLGNKVGIQAALENAETCGELIRASSMTPPDLLKGPTASTRHKINSLHQSLNVASWNKSPSYLLSKADIKISLTIYLPFLCLFRMQKSKWHVMKSTNDANKLPGKNIKNYLAMKHLFFIHNSAQNSSPVCISMEHHLH